MAIDLIPKPPKETLPWEKAMTVASFVFLAGAISFLVILGWLSSNTKREVTRLTQELNKEKTVEEQKLENEVLGDQKYLAAFAFFIDSKKPLLPVLSLIEKTTHPQVFFSKTDYSAKDNKISLSGKTDNFQVLGQQHILFKNATQIKESNLLQAGIGKTGFVELSFEIFLNPGIFKTK
jgi:hypothetical protein